MNVTTVRKQRSIALSILVPNTARAFHITLMLLGLLGFGLVIFSTRWGPFLGDDSYYYIYPARAWAAGNGFLPSSTYAPFFPFVLGLLNLIGVDAIDGARILNAILFGVNIYLVGTIVRRMGASYIFAGLASLVVLLTDVLIEIHGWAMSEALSITLSLLAISFTQHYVENGRRGWWVACAAVCSMAVLTRYAAVAIIPTVMLTLLVFAPIRGWWKRVGWAALFGFLSILPIGAYLLRNVLTTGSLFHYQAYYYVPFNRDQVVWFFYNLLSFFIPGRFLRGREIVSGLLALVLVAGVVILVHSQSRRQPAAVGDRVFKPGLMLLAGFFGFSFLMLVLARGFTNLDVFNTRYLLPMLLVLLMLLVDFIGRAWRVGRWPLRSGVVAFLVIFIAYYGYRSVDFLRYARETGVGYLNIGWQNSETIPYLMEQPNLDVVSTADTAVYFWTGRMPTVITAFGEASALHQHLCESGATLVIFNQMPVEAYQMDPAQVTAGLTLVRSFNDSQMYRCTQ